MYIFYGFNAPNSKYYDNEKTVVIFTHPILCARAKHDFFFTELNMYMDVANAWSSEYSAVY